MDVLYHASPDKNLEIIEPKKTLSKDVYIGDYVFATSDKKLAVMYLATRGNYTYMEPRGNEPFIVICAKPKEYLVHDEGGAIYILSSDTFEKTPQIELKDFEMVSSVSVKPTKKETYNNSIEAMRRNGITIYFVSQPKFDELIKAKDKNNALALVKPFQ